MIAMAVGSAGAAVVAAAVGMLALTTVLRACRTPTTDRLAIAGGVLSVPLLVAAGAVVAVRFLELSYS